MGVQTKMGKIPKYLGRHVFLVKEIAFTLWPKQVVSMDEMISEKT